MKTIEELAEENVETILELEEKARESRSTSEKVIDKITSFCGTVPFVWLNASVFLAWVLINTFILPKPYDPYPFTFLTFCVSLEAIFLSLFILITQNREAEIEAKRNTLDLEVNLLSEQENTKILDMLTKISDKLGVPTNDSTLEVLKSETDTDKLMDDLEAKSS